VTGETGEDAQEDEEREPVCGEDFCPECGCCMACFFCTLDECCFPNRND